MNEFSTPAIDIIFPFLQSKPAYINICKKTGKIVVEICPSTNASAS